MFETDQAKINNREGIEQGKNHDIIIKGNGKENGVTEEREKRRRKKVKRKGKEDRDGSRKKCNEREMREMQ